MNPKFCFGAMAIESKTQKSHCSLYCLTKVPPTKTSYSHFDLSPKISVVLTAIYWVDELEMWKILNEYVKKKFWCSYFTWTLASRVHHPCIRIETHKRQRITISLLDSGISKLKASYNCLNNWYHFVESILLRFDFYYWLLLFLFYYFHNKYLLTY